MGRSGPYGEYRKRDPRERFLEKADRSGGDDACWPWLGFLNDGGYGTFSIGSRQITAQRAAYELFVGPIPGGLDIDHLCHTKECAGGRGCPHRRCVNPGHLAPATRSENLRRGWTGAHPPAPGSAPDFQRAKTHCPKGHLYDEANTYHPLRRPASRACRACHRERTRERRARARA